ncbi:hypothetical protein H4R18_001231 [Coemansia javaensis]|uniref:RING-type domain-containing protein n=1 Tax=Coemansia javaensis TaxID=2761396 RepID=A0A9W8HHR0_9FUNG|nr:hypothetical protein H4R18_001231 [Coemansia javaensis]
MIVARRFQAPAPAPDPGPAIERTHPPGQILLQLRPTERTAKPYNPFRKDELPLLEVVTLGGPDVDALKSAAQVEDGSGVLRYASPECSICLLQYEAGAAARVLSCGHVYHAECIDVWLTQRSSRCPICKADARLALGLPLRRSASVLVGGGGGNASDNDGAQGQHSHHHHHHVVDVATPPPVLLSDHNHR